MKKLNILRVPPEVELMGLDNAEYVPNLYLPEVAPAGELIVEPDGTWCPRKRYCEPRETRWWSRCRCSSTARPTASPTRSTTARDDLADFILQDNYKDCAGFGTFMPGSTYGEDGSGAETLYMILTWVGIVVMVVVLVAWVLYENRRLIGAVAGISAAGTPIEGVLGGPRRRNHHFSPERMGDDR